MVIFLAALILFRYGLGIAYLSRIAPLFLDLKLYSIQKHLLRLLDLHLELRVRNIGEVIFVFFNFCLRWKNARFADKLIQTQKWMLFCDLIISLSVEANKGLPWHRALRFYLAFVKLFGRLFAVTPLLEVAQSISSWLSRTYGLRDLCILRIWHRLFLHSIRFLLMRQSNLIYFGYILQIVPCFIYLLSFHKSYHIHSGLPVLLLLFVKCLIWLLKLSSCLHWQIVHFLVIEKIKIELNFKKIKNLD